MPPDETSDVSEYKQLEEAVELVKLAGREREEVLLDDGSRWVHLVLVFPL